MQASWNNTVIALSNETVVVEGNHYFPRASVDIQYLRQSATQTVCVWKGTASYFDVVVDGQVNKGAAWYYRDPKPAASEIAGRIAFWKSVAVSSR